MPREVPCDLIVLIDSWSQTVSQQADYSLQPSQLSPRTLRPRPTPRPQAFQHHTRPLAPISHNPRIPKRLGNQEEEDYSAIGTRLAKRARRMESDMGEDGDPLKRVASPVKKEGAKRGRPPKKHNPPSVMPPAPILNPSNSGSKSKPGSPKRAKSRTNPKIDASIDMEYLKSCKPSVLLKTPQEIMVKGPIPQQTLSLYQRLKDVPYGCIPGELKADFMRENALLSAADFLPLNHQPFPPDCLQSLKRTVNGVVKDTVWNGRRDVHERQWGTTTVSPLINELKLWPELQHCVLMNVESCAIEPIEIRIERPDGKLLEAETVESVETRESESPLTTTRMVDLSIGLHMKDDDEEIVSEAFSNIVDHDQSLNQSLSYVRYTPLLVDLELKKLNSNRSPRVQLAIWKAGAYRKMLYHGWDTSMPLPGITVDGSKWEMFLFFERDSKLIMMGPLKMGSTDTIEDTFQIAYKLYILMKWAKTDYEPWFQKHVLKWCKHKANGTLAPDAGLKSLQL